MRKQALNKTPTPLEKCLGIINYLMKNKLAGPFNQPVDPERDGAVGYFDVIKEPRDFGTIKEKLTKEINSSNSQDPNPDPAETPKYTVELFMEDVRLVFSNCKLYNPPDHPITTYATNLAKLFEKKLIAEDMDKKPDPVESETNTETTSEPPKKGPAKSKTSKKRPKSDEDSDDSGRSSGSSRSRPKKKTKKKDFESGEESSGPSNSRNGRPKSDDGNAIPRNLDVPKPPPPPAPVKLALTEQEKQEWARNLRLNFTPLEMLMPEGGDIDHDFFKPNKEQIKRPRGKWEDKHKLLLLQGIQTHGIGNWQQIRSEFLPEWEENELRVKTIRLMGRQNLQAYKGLKFTPKEVEKEYQKNFEIGQSTNAWKNGILVADDKGLVAEMILKMQQEEAK